MSSEKCPMGDHRQAFMKGYGFVLYTHVTEQLIGQLEEEPIPSAQAYQNVRDTIEPLRATSGGVYESAASLYAATSLFKVQVPDRTSTGSFERITRFSMTREERYEAWARTFELGLDDLDFSWTFTPAIAASVMYAFRRTGLLSEADARAITLDDWSQMLQKDWFGQIAHTLARTGFGVYQDFGERLPEYAPRALEEKLNWAARKYGEPEIHDTDLFIVHEDQENIGLTRLSATVHPDYKELLIAMRNSNRHLKVSGGSVGCTVARRCAWIAEDWAETMPRAVSLQKMGRLTISDRVNDEGMVLATLDKTAIDRTVAFIGEQIGSLAWYHALQD